MASLVPETAYDPTGGIAKPEKQVVKNTGHDTTWFSTAPHGKRMFISPSQQRAEYRRTKKIALGPVVHAAGPSTVVSSPEWTWAEKT